MAKGGEYERELCVRLSLWWTKYDAEPREDLFWRTSGSGARATVRGRKGKKTSGHSGDISSTDPSTKPFSDVFALESKRGYNRTNIHDILDRSAKAKVQSYEEWITQAESSRANSGSYAWMLIHKRDYREPMMFMPGYAASRLNDADPLVTIESPDWNVAGFLLYEWLDQTDPDSIIELAKGLK